MKILRVLLTTFVFASVQYAASAQSSLGLRSEVGAFLFSNQNYGTEFSQSAAVTRELDSAGDQEASLSFVNTTLDYSDPWLALDGFPANSLKGHFQPVLAGYRYYFHPWEARVRFFSGVDIGSVRFSGTVRSRGAIVEGHETNRVESSFTRWRTSAGLSIGCEYSFTRHWGVQFSYRYLYVSELGDFAASASVNSFHVGSLNAHALFLGLSNRF